MKKYLPFIGLIVIVFVYLMWYRLANAVIIGETSFTHKDIDTLYQLETELGGILGTNVVNSKEDVLYNLSVSSLQKQVLQNNGVELNREQILQSEENNVLLKGFYQQAKDNLGIDEYYRLLIEPVAVSKLYVNFYELANTANRNALAVLASLRNNVTLEQIAANNGVQLVDLAIDKASNSELTSQLNNRTGIYPRPIAIGDNIIIAEVIGYEETTIVLKAIVFKKNSYKQFITNTLNTGKIEFPFYSVYNKNDLIEKEGSILQ